MAIDPSYLEFVLEQLSSVLPAINHRPMFGGVGIYTHGLFFALIADDTLYFYTDASNQDDYLALDMQTASAFIITRFPSLCSKNLRNCACGLKKA